MSDANHQRDTHRQRVLDRALVEAVGGETPPDLSERILERAAITEIPDKQHPMSKKAGQTRTSKILFSAIAASILLIVTSGFLWIRHDLRTTRMSARRNDIEELPPAEIERAASTSSATASGDHTDFGALLEMANTTVNPEAIDGEANEDANGRVAPENEFESNLSIVVSQSQELQDAVVLSAGGEFGLPPKTPRLVYPSAEVGQEVTAGRAKYGPTDLSQRDESLRMMVTPRILIQEQEEMRLSVGHESRGDGRGPGLSGDRYTRVVENPFLTVGQNPLSTFSIDVDTASYANVRQYLTQGGQLPPPDAVRIEELVNYFRYDYAAPTSDGEPPFAAHMEVTGCPWEPKHRLVRIGLKGREVAGAKRPPSNLVFLVDVSGSMDEPNQLPLVMRGLKTLAKQLEENDRVAIVVYASAEGLVLDSTPGTRAEEIVNVLNQLEAGGSTNGGAGIELAYRIAGDHFIQGGTNRVILCTDGDFNVGTTSTAALERLVEEKAQSGIFLTVLGFGRGNLNDQMMETISGRGNGNYYYIDSDREAQKVLVEEMGGTLVTIAKDVKIQVEFNPATTAAYRLVGYENRMLAKEDFNDDTQDAGEIGAGHTVTAIYELVPRGVEEAEPRAGVDPLKYQRPAKPYEATSAVASDELLTLKLRYKEPAEDTSKLLTFPLSDEGHSFGQASADTKFAASVAMFGMLLRDSRYQGNATFAAAAEIAEEGVGEDHGGYRSEFVKLIRQAKSLGGE